MILSAAHASAVNANAWQQKRQFDYGLALERAVLNIMRPLERNQKRGSTTDAATTAIHAKLKAMGCPFAAKVTVAGARKKSQSYSRERTLQLTVPHPVYKAELNVYLHGLQPIVKSLGFDKMEVRVG
jgi:hypothetical protein